MSIRQACVFVVVEHARHQAFMVLTQIQSTRMKAILTTRKCTSSLGLPRLGSVKVRVASVYYHHETSTSGISLQSQQLIISGGNHVQHFLTSRYQSANIYSALMFRSGESYRVAYPMHVACWTILSLQVAEVTSQRAMSATMLQRLGQVFSQRQLEPHHCGVHPDWSEDYRGPEQF